jgi:solute:Na+ symporter, SSS family
VTGIVAAVIVLGHITPGGLSAAIYNEVLQFFFNAPRFATFILGMFWRRMTATAGWAGLVSGTLAAVLVAVLREDSLGAASVGVLPLSGQ